MSLVIDLTGWVVLVTGGGRGVGRGIVESYLAAGADVEICGRTVPEELPRVDGRVARFTAVDVRESDQVEAWVAEIAGTRGRIDVAVNNAGGAPFAGFGDASMGFHRKIVELNFIAAAIVAHAVYPVMSGQAQGGGIINISSISARRPSPGTAMYGAAKAAVESLTGSLAVEWAPLIRVNAVSCGLVVTESAAEHYGDAEEFARIAATIPRGRFAEPREIGDACVMLSSPLANHITGAVLDVDGGGEWPAFLAQSPNSQFQKRPGGL
jgi:NAD(P)-dependent dehydrogenase (short-subunit alcohol dehydrogenase family)